MNAFIDRELSVLREVCVMEPDFFAARREQADALYWSIAAVRRSPSAAVLDELQRCLDATLKTLPPEILLLDGLFTPRLVSIAREILRRAAA